LNEFGEKKTTFAYQKNFLFFASKTFTFATQSRGSKQYELTDHLGNIRTVVPDIKEPLSLPQNQNFRLPTLTLNNYYPYGMLQAGRTKNAGGYRFGYQGQEADNKIGGLGQHLNYTFRNYDSWIIRFGAIDPLAGKYPYWSPFAFSGNRVIDAVELEGLEPNPLRLLWDKWKVNFEPQTTASIRLQAIKHKIFETTTYPPQTRIGRIYEDAVIASLGFIKNKDSFYSSDPLAKGVKPDIVGESGTNILNISTMKRTRYQFPNALFTDAKYAANINKDSEYNQAQLRTMIDVLAEMKGGYVGTSWRPNMAPSDYGAAVLVLVVPYNTEIEHNPKNTDIDYCSLIEYATQRNVQLYRRDTEQDPNNPSYMRVSAIVTPLNVVSTGSDPSYDNIIKAPGQGVDMDWSIK
jgi:RHS repeat-associated protein